MPLVARALRPIHWGVTVIAACHSVSTVSPDPKPLIGVCGSESADQVDARLRQPIRFMWDQLMAEKSVPVLSVLVLDGAISDSTHSRTKVLDSLWNADSTKYLQTLAHIVTDPLMYSHQAGSNAASEFTRRRGPNEWMLRALNGPALTDGRRLLILDALYGPLTPAQQSFLLQQACGIALGLKAATPSMAEIQRITGWEDPPSWYEYDLLTLDAIRELLDGRAAAEFDRVIGPVAERADEEIARWIRS